MTVPLLGIRSELSMLSAPPRMRRFPAAVLLAVSTSVPGPVFVKPSVPATGTPIDVTPAATLIVPTVDPASVSGPVPERVYPPTWKSRERAVIPAGTLTVPGALAKTASSLLELTQAWKTVPSGVRLQRVSVVFHVPVPPPTGPTPSPSQ